MKARRIDGQAVNGERNILSEVLPLDTPYSVTFFPIYACNFKCSYCLHSLSENRRGHVSDIKLMDFELYKKCIDDISAFPQKVKVIHFAGIGEPLLCKDITRMINYAVEKNASNSVDIVTNGSLITKSLADDLVSSGLSKIRISIQGLTSEKYKRFAGVDINFDEFIENLQYLYENKENMKIYIKIIDSALSEEDEKKFFDIFGDICDSIAIEHLCPFVEKIDYKTTFENNEFITTMNGNIVINSEVCPQPFYSMQIYPDGKCVPCCTVEKPIVIGDCNNRTVVEIWNGKELNNFRKMHLIKKKSNNKVCEKCQQYKYSMFPGESLDNDAERLLKLF